MNSVQVFQASNSGVETVTNSFLMHKVSCIRQGDTLYIFFISVQRKAEAHIIKLLVNYSPKNVKWGNILTKRGR